MICRYDLTFPVKSREFGLSETALDVRVKRNAYMAEMLESQEWI